MIMWDSIVIKFYTFLHIQRYIIFYTMTKIFIHYVYIFIYILVAQHQQFFSNNGNFQQIN